MSYKIIKVGRAKDNDIVLTDPSVSRYHCEFFFDDSGNVFLTDKDSSNGTFVNGKRIQGSIQLNSNDIVKPGLDLPLKWKNFQQSNESYVNPEYASTNEHSIGNDAIETVSKPKSNVLKTVLITLGVIALIIASFYLINEYYGDSKPDSLDKNKPNDERSQPSKTERKIDYDFSCLSDENDFGTTEVINGLETIDSQVTEVLGGEITIEDEQEVGNQLLKDCRAKYNFIEHDERILNLKMILSYLVAEIKEPKGFNYEIFLIDSDELNAFTAGAKIFVTTRMYEFCRTNDELACVIGHEINHNELGHIKQHLQKERILTTSGAALQQMLTISFGQKKETHCDFKGIDLAIAAGYNGCVNIELWKRVKIEFQEKDYDVVENLLRSHPYSEKRSVCSENHIKTNYGFDCTNN